MYDESALTSSRRKVLGLAGGAVAALALGPAGRAAAQTGARAAADVDARTAAAAAVAIEIRRMRFPVVGPVRYSNDFGAPRSGGRRHQGNDLLGTKLQKLVAANNGRITSLRVEPSGLSGNMCVLTDRKGWTYYYIHVNNDSPGTDDGTSPRRWAFPPGIEEGVEVVAGQHIAYMGDSGNAEATSPHVHFELHRPDGTVINPYDSLRVAAKGPAAEGRSVAARVGRGCWALTDAGTVNGLGGARTLGSPRLKRGMARSIAAMPDGKGYAVLDREGGVHFFGTAAMLLAHRPTPTWPGWDIARDIAITPDGGGYVVLDGYGGVHARGNAPVGPRVYWRDWDIARSVAVSASGAGLYVLDAYGGVHAAGDALGGGATPYWGRHMACAIVASPAGRGYAVLDVEGGLHVAGDAPPATASFASGGGGWRSLATRANGYLAIRDDALVQRS